MISEIWHNNPAVIWQFVRIEFKLVERMCHVIWWDKYSCGYGLTLIVGFANAGDQAYRRRRYHIRRMAEVELGIQWRRFPFRSYFTGSGAMVRSAGVYAQAFSFSPRPGHLVPAMTAGAAPQPLCDSKVYIPASKILALDLQRLRTVACLGHRKCNQKHSIMM